MEIRMAAYRSHADHFWNPFQEVEVEVVVRQYLFRASFEIDGDVRSKWFCHFLFLIFCLLYIQKIRKKTALFDQKPEIHESIV